MNGWPLELFGLQFVASLLKELPGVRVGAVHSEQVIRSWGRGAMSPKPADKLLWGGKDRKQSLGRVTVDDSSQ